MNEKYSHVRIWVPCCTVAFPSRVYIQGIQDCLVQRSHRRRSPTATVSSRSSSKADIKYILLLFAFKSLALRTSGKLDSFFTETDPSLKQIPFQGVAQYCQTTLPTKVTITYF